MASDSPAHPESFCATTIFRTLHAATKGEDTVLYRVVRTSSDPNPPPAWHSATEAASGLLGHLLGDLAGDVLSALKLQPTVPCIALKQVRSAANASQACFQTIVESPIALTAFTGAGLLLDAYSVEITTCDSHRIVADFLGHPPTPGTTTLPVRAAGWLSGDFTALPGRDIVVST